MSKELDNSLRYIHPRRLCSALPGVEKMAAENPAALYGVEEATFLSARERLRTHQSQAVRQLIKTPEFEAFSRRPRLDRGDVVLAIGDSLTDDSLSWIELIRGSILEAKGPSYASVINVGVSGFTTSDVLSNLIPHLKAYPNWVIFMIGTNDARRHGWNRSHPLHGASQTQQNLAAIVALTSEKTTAEQLWLTPPPVLEGQQHDHWLLRDQEIWYSNQDLGVIASLVKRQPAATIDLWPDFTGQRRGVLYSEDGVHLTAEGQIVVARRVLAHLTSP